MGEVGSLLPPLSISMHTFVPSTPNSLGEEKKHLCHLHVCLAPFLFSVQKFSLFFRGGGVDEVVRKLETEPPTVEVSQPSILWCVDFGNGQGFEGGCWCCGTDETEFEQSCVQHCRED